MCYILFLQTPVTEDLNNRWNAAKLESPAHQLTGALWALTLLFFGIFDSLSATVVPVESESQTVPDNNCHQSVRERSNDSVWARLDRWSRWGMNSCRRGLADRTWSVTRWLWRDRYTLCCLEENNYTQCCTANSVQSTSSLNSFMSSRHFHLTVSIFTSMLCLCFMITVYSNPISPVQ